MIHQKLLLLHLNFICSHLHLEIVFPLIQKEQFHPNSSGTDARGASHRLSPSNPGQKSSRFPQISVQELHERSTRAVTPQKRRLLLKPGAIPGPGSEDPIPHLSWPSCSSHLCPALSSRAHPAPHLCTTRSSHAHPSLLTCAHPAPHLCPSLSPHLCPSHSSRARPSPHLRGGVPRTGRRLQGRASAGRGVHGRAGSGQRPAPPALCRAESRP